MSLKIRSFKLGALLALLAVVAGAFGAHAIKEKVSASLLEAWHTASYYQLFHAIAILICSLLGLFGSVKEKDRRYLAVTCSLFAFGILFFSGSLYLMTLLSLINRNYPSIGLLTPVGGVLFVAGWLRLVIWKPE